MKRMHVHVAVADLEQSIGFYSALFAAQPAVIKADYAKWMLDDPRVNFAVSTRGKLSVHEEFPDATMDAIGPFLGGDRAPAR